MKKNKLDYIWDLPRVSKRVISTLSDIVFIILSFYGAYWSRIDNINFINQSNINYVALLNIGVTLFIFINLGLYRSVIRYLTFHTLAIISIGSVISALGLAVIAFYFNVDMPRSIPIIYGSFLCLLCSSSHLLFRIFALQTSKKKKIPVLIYGAGAAGRRLAIALRSSEKHRVIAFVDEDSTLHRTIVMGIKVFNTSDISDIVKKYTIKQVLFAIPSISRTKRKQIFDSLVDLPAQILTVPDMEDIVEGKAKIDELKHVAIEDLLGRESVSPQQPLMEASIKNKIVMVTGAGGSIGSEICRQIVQQQPNKLILFEVSEFALYQIDRELRQIIKTHNLDIEIVPLLGSVQRINRLQITMNSFHVQTVYHAAAYKHVPLVEYNAEEGVRNNIFGTYYTAQAAIEAGVELFVLISTDKAVRPTNVMGATKRMAELALQSLAEQENNKANGTKFCMVRFGNVLGSSGSVVPLFKRQIESGGPVTVTHPDIIRYFMTIPEAAQLVIQAGTMSKGGEVFVLDMGDPVRIIDLATNLIQLSGLEVKSSANPLGDIEIQFTGLRPGEKLYEELLIGENVQKTAHKRIMAAKERFLPFEEFHNILIELNDACRNLDHKRIRDILLNAPTGFNPTDDIGDLIWNHQKNNI
ncbi:TPA: polysaccharide biosynthesis protein [Morganella morganii]|nr:polysaccharide biosynthesis protein [Morganella morganii]